GTFVGGCGHGETADPGVSAMHSLFAFMARIAGNPSIPGWSRSRSDVSFLRMGRPRSPEDSVCLWSFRIFRLVRAELCGSDLFSVAAGTRDAEISSDACSKHPHRMCHFRLRSSCRTVAHPSVLEQRIESCDSIVGGRCGESGVTVPALRR